MGTLLDKAMVVARELPPAEQDEIAMLVLAIAGEDLPAFPLSPGELTSLKESLAQADRGEFVSDGELEAVWKKHGL
jgi:predicted transcriptional regulator